MKDSFMQRQRISRVSKTLPLALGLALVSLVSAPPAFAVPVQATQASQLVTIKGVVTDSRGERLAGVTIMEKGSSRGTTTDVDGNYTLRVAPGSTITFSSIGLKPQQLACLWQAKETLPSTEKLG